MEIQKIFSDQYDEERLYSVLMTEDEVALFSKLQDEDYYERHNKRKKDAKYAPAAGAVLGGMIGASPGATIGYGLSNGNPVGALAGAGAGALAGGGLGYLLGKKGKRKVNEDADRKIKRYKAASEKDRAYLRDKEERDMSRAIQQQQANALLAMALR